MPAKCRLVVVGNCQAEVVHGGLQHESLNGRFEPVYHFVDLPPERHAQGISDLARCDIVLAQDISNWDQYPLRDHVPPGIEVIQFPCVRFASLWPFDSYNGMLDRAAAARPRPDSRPVYFDGMLARLRQKYPDPQERFERYRDLRIDGLVSFQRMHSFEEQRLRGVDARFGCRIGELILDQFRQERLFHSTVHPIARIYALVMEVVLQRLGIPQAFPVDSRMEMVEGVQVPVHPLIAKALGVTWCTADTTYVVGDRRLTWEQYTRWYIERFG